MINADRSRPVMLGADEELALIRQSQAGDSKATARLIKAYEPLIRKMTRNQANGDENLRDDLEQDARIGLLNAIRRFDVNSGLRLSTYGRWQIDCEVKDARRRVPLIKIPYSGELRRAVNNMGRARRKLGIDACERMTRADVTRVATDLGVRPHVVDEVNGYAMMNATVSLDAPTHRDGSMTVAETVVDTDHDISDLHHRIDRQRRIDAIRQALSTMKPRRREIIERRYLGDDDVTLRDIATTYGVSSQAIGMMEIKALTDLQEALPARLAP